MLQIAEAAVQDALAVGTRGGAEVGTVDQRHFQAALGGVEGDPGAVDPGPHHQYVETLGAEAREVASPGRRVAGDRVHGVGMIHEVQPAWRSASSSGLCGAAACPSSRRTL